MCPLFGPGGRHGLAVDRHGVQRSTDVPLSRSVIRQSWQTPPSLQAHFSPKGGCTEAIVAELKHARREVLVQAYSFTCPDIAKALIEAKQRGAEVIILLDRANEKETYSELKMLEENGVIP